MHVNAFPKIKPELVFKNLQFNNTQIIDFHWKDNKKEGYPIAFSVSNSNPYFEVVNIESYAIPELKREIKPTFWKRIGSGANEYGKPLLFFGIGVGTLWLLLK